jgi:hypothetical protein
MSHFPPHVHPASLNLSRLFMVFTFDTAGVHFVKPQLNYNTKITMLQLLCYNYNITITMLQLQYYNYNVTITTLQLQYYSSEERRGG